MNRTMRKPALLAGAIVFWVALVSAALTGALFAQDTAAPAVTIVPPAVAAARQTVQKGVDGYMNQPGFSHAAYSCVIRTLDTHETVYALNPDKLMMTASCMKLMTSSAIIDALGPDFRYTTRLLASCPVGSDGVLKGNIILQGSGDPSFPPAAVTQMAKEAAQRGLKKVDGYVFADTGNFSSTPYGPGWSWDYLTDYYAAPVGGLNMAENVVSIIVKPGDSVGAPARLEFVPDTHYLRISNSVTTVAAGGTNVVYLDRDPGATTIKLSGTMPIDAKDSDSDATVAVQDPADYTADYLRQELIRAGIEVTGGIRKGPAPKEAVQITQWVSQPLSDILHQLNKHSDNEYAEALLRTLGSQTKGEGSIDAGRETAYAFYKRAGLDIDGVNQVDGSGLSRLGMVSAGNFVTLLDSMYHHKYGGVWRDTLPVAGVDGSLAGRMKGTVAEGNCKAKTGYIGTVSTLCGYVTTKAGQPLVFAVMFNNVTGSIAPCRKAEDDVAVLLAGFPEKL